MPASLKTSTNARAQRSTTAAGPDLDGRPKALGRPELRKVREFVLERCPDGFGDLERVAADRGEYLWVCPRHRPLYDKDLPTVDAT